MADSRVVWLGSEHLDSSSVHEEGAPSVAVVRVANPAHAEMAISRLPQGTKVVAVVEKSEDIVRALEAGAHDAVVAEAEGTELSARVRLWERVAAEEHALRERLAKAEEQALRDDLTGLGNRRSFGRALEYAIDYSSRYGGPLSVVLVDLDGMKRVNDQQGHPAGDVALRMVADVLRLSVRSTDHAARLGGDEFAMVMVQASAADVAYVCERIRERISLLPVPGGMKISASFGIAQAETGRGASDLFARADAALYEAKRTGKDRVVVDVNSASTSASAASGKTAA
jgi:diguanylate cyclase (GGDEF)-like protein